MDSLFEAQNYKQFFVLEGMKNSLSRNDKISLASNFMDEYAGDEVVDLIAVGAALSVDEFLRDEAFWMP